MPAFAQSAAPDDLIRDRLDAWFAAAHTRREERERAARLDRMRSLDARSDAELAAMGLTRRSIAAHVFRDLFDL